tara:strand:+ start:144 stop:617 length:474 start_codon:yes stop_codon:yes gene_type:complete
MAAYIANKSANTGMPAHTMKAVMLANIIDFAVVEASAGITIGTTDTFRLIGVPKGFVVTAGGWEVITAETGAATSKMELGDGGSTARYGAAAIFTTAGDYSVPVDITYQYTADDTVDLLSSVAAATNGKLRVWVVGFDVNDIGSTADITDNNTWTTA